MAPKIHPSGRSPRPPHFILGLLVPGAAHILAPLLIALSILAGIFLLPSLFSSHSGHPLPARFLLAASTQTPETTLPDLVERPTRLAESLPAGPLWLLADLPAELTAAQTVPQELLLPTHTLTHAACWLLERADYPATEESPYAFTPLTLHAGVAGTLMLLPSHHTARQVMCHASLAIPDQLSIERWDRADLADAAIRTARSIGLLQGGLLTLALFVIIIALTMREWLYVLLGCWLVGSLRLGAWALGWDYQWLGFLIPPEALPWVRKLTLVLCYLVTYHLFTELFRESLDTATQRQVHTIGNISTALLLIATLGLPYSWFQTIVFLAAWLGTGLTSILLIHALFQSHTRARLWHTIGVCVALSIMLIGLILVGLQQGDLIDPQLATIALLLCDILIALAVADQMREGRQTRSRERNDLIAHDSLTPLGIFTLGATRQFEHMNPKLRAMLAVGEDDAFPSWTDFFPAMDWLDVSLATEQGREVEIRATQAGDTGSPHSFLLRATLAGSRVEGSLQDVSARSETIRNLRLMADNDPLTDTLNRRGIETAMQASIDALRESSTPAALAYLNLDHLKRVNDLFGHNAGDSLLQIVCERAKHALNEYQKIGRVGADEFIILFPNMRAADAQHIGQDIIESLNSAPVTIGERSFPLKTAMGIIDIDSKMDPKDAITAASRACRDARQQHLDIVLYEENADELSDHFNEQHLFEQLEKNQPPPDVLYLELQPIMSLRRPLETLNFEALLRVRSPDDRPVQTQNIIDAAEENGVITTIDRWVFTTLLDWLTEHHAELPQTKIINVNLSGVSLNDSHFIDMLFTLLNRQPQLTRRLCVEITEGVALQDLERTRQFMRSLQRMGARVALDDFGAGYTSFSYLKELPADMIKIDGSLIRDMLASEANIAIVNSIVDLAHNLGMECLAEWVEDVPTLRALADMGVDHVQGYVVSPARPPEDILAQTNLLPLISDPAVRSYIAEIISQPASA